MRTVEGLSRFTLNFWDATDGCFNGAYHSHCGQRVRIPGGLSCSASSCNGSLNARFPPPSFTYKADKALVKRGTKDLQMAEY